MKYHSLDIRKHFYYGIYSTQKEFGPLPSISTLLFRRLHRLLRWNSIRFLFRCLCENYIDRLPPLNPCVFFPVSSNNKRALLPIWKVMDNGMYTIIDDKSLQKYAPWPLVYLHSFLHLYPLLRCYFSGNYREREIMRGYFDEHFEIVGYLIVMQQIFARNNVRLLVVSNDHSYTPICMRMSAQECGIKVMYIQHCSVTEHFPSLSFDISLLDGEESIEKYIEAGKLTGLVYAMGNPRFDIIKQNHTDKYQNTQRIGIAINSLDSENKIRHLCLQLISYGYHDITIRPHPETFFDSMWYIDHGIKISDSNEENPFAFIARMDYVISGECGIHLDTALMHKCAIYYNMTNNKSQDVYSFVKNGITHEVSNIEELCAFLTKDVNDVLDAVEKKMSWYNASYKTPYDGHVGEVIADFIKYELMGELDRFNEKYHFIPQKKNNYSIYVCSDHVAKEDM